MLKQLSVHRSGSLLTLREDAYLVFCLFNCEWHIKYIMCEISFTREKRKQQSIGL